MITNEEYLAQLNKLIADEGYLVEFANTILQHPLYINPNEKRVRSVELNKLGRYAVYLPELLTHVEVRPVGERILMWLQEETLHDKVHAFLMAHKDELSQIK